MACLQTSKRNFLKRPTRKRYTRCLTLIEREANAPKVKGILKRLADRGITSFKIPDIEFVLNTSYAEGDQERALDLLLLVEESENFIVRPYDPNIKLLGAVNRHAVTCYLDATLFAIFARLESFEAILYNTFDDEPRKRLSALLRLWVNSLRSGKLITTDIVCSSQPILRGI
jgi:hypothetical protein